MSLGGLVGEGHALSLAESEEIIARATASAARHSHFSMRVLFEIEEDDPERSAALAELAVAGGAEGLYVGTPEHSDEALVRHLDAILAVLERPVPIALMAGAPRTGALAKIRSSAVVARCQPFDRPSQRRRQQAGPRDAETELAPLTANDRMIVPALRDGAIGALTAVGNLVPAEVRSLMESAIHGRSDTEARERALAPLIDALRSGPPAVAVKEALAALDAIGPEVRAPHAPMRSAARRHMRRALEAGRLRVPH